MIAVWIFSLFFQRSLWADAPKDSSAFLRDWKAVERLVWSERPHAAERALTQLGADCDAFDKLSPESLSPELQGRVGLICALVRAEQVERSSGIGRYLHLKAFKDSEYQFRSSALQGPDRYWGDAKLALAAPPERGETARRALIPLAFWTRLEPAKPEPDFIAGLAHARLGNREASREAFERATAKATGDEFREAPSARSERLRFGLGAGLFYAPQAGFGVSARWRDDRMSDSPFSLLADAEVASRNRLGISLVARAADVAGGYTPELRIAHRYGKEDFFGLGNAFVSNPTIFATTRSLAEFSVAKVVVSDLSFRLGWALKSYFRRETENQTLLAQNLVDNDSSFSAGPLAELTWDSRDSQNDALSGFLIQVGGYFPSQFLGSEQSYESWLARAEANVRLVSWLSLRLRGLHQGVSGSAPYAAYAKSGEESFIPGMRYGRFQNSQLGLTSAEFRFRAWGPLLAGLFVSGVSHPAWDKGIGAALEWNFSRYRDNRARFEFSRTAGEWVFQAVLAEAL